MHAKSMCASGGGRSLLTFVVLSVALSAQMGTCPVAVPAMPEGRWVGPYEFAAMQSGGYLQEIAHAAVLPPPSGHEDVIRVIMWCRPTYDEAMLQPAKSFLWKPSRPTIVTTLPISASAAPPNEPEGQWDPFCGGHTFTPEGDLVVVGGLNVFKTVQDCLDPNFDDCILINPANPSCGVDNRYSYGHRNAYRLRTDVDPPTWDAAPLTMYRERWYPTAVTMQDGRPLISGHLGQPGPNSEDCAPVPLWVDPFGTLTSLEVRESFEPVQGVFEQIERHQLWDGGTCATVIGHEHEDYPRLVLLANRHLMHVNDELPTTPPPPITRVADLTLPTCPSEGFRWQDAGAPAANRHGGSAVHFVVRNPEIMFGAPTDVVYAIGGVQVAGDANCTMATNPSTDSVEKMIDPRAGTPWTTAPPLPDLKDPLDLMDYGVGRGSHNSVILLDGSILVVGGASYKVGSPCFGFLSRTAIRYCPPEVFYDAPPSVDDWKVMATQSVGRRYHSVAGLLPDGRVFSAGGEGEGTPGAKHSLEIYEPDYCFDPNRPVITSAPSVLEIGNPQAQLVDVTTCPFREVGRVALIRNGSVTHAFDFNQRYIELAVGIPQGSPPNVTIPVTPPEDEFIAPPGWYMLVVMDDTGLPSEGKWVQVVKP